MKRWLKRRQKTTFGTMVDVPVSTGLMLVCVNRGGGWEPKRVLLPHQLYTQDAEKWIAEGKNSMRGPIEEIVCFPLDHESFIRVWGDKP